MDVFTFVTHVSAFMSQRTTLGKYLALPRTDFLYQLTRSCCLSVFICLCLLVLSRSPSPLLLTSHLYPLKQTRCKGSQHCCANEKNAGFTLGFQHHICLNTVTLVNCNVIGDYVPLLSLSLYGLPSRFLRLHPALCWSLGFFDSCLITLSKAFCLPVCTSLIPPV